MSSSPAQTHMHTLHTRPNPQLILECCTSSTSRQTPDMCKQMPATLPVHNQWLTVKWLALFSELSRSNQMHICCKYLRFVFESGLVLFCESYLSFIHMLKSEALHKKQKQHRCNTPCRSWVCTYWAVQKMAVQVHSCAQWRWLCLAGFYYCHWSSSWWCTLATWPKGHSLATLTCNPRVLGSKHAQAYSAFTKFKLA